MDWKTSTLNAVILCLTLCVVTEVQGNARFTAQILANGLYKVEHYGANWMDGGGYVFHADGKRYSDADGNLRQLVPPESSNGTDKLGTWNMMNFTWGVGGKRVYTTFKMYHMKDAAAAADHSFQFIIFSQHFPDGLEGTSVGDENGVASAFPSVNVKPGIGMLVYADLMSGWYKREITTWSKNHTKLPDGLLSGPVVLFDQNHAAMVVSPFSHFMAANMYHNTSGSRLDWGVMGKVDSIPPGYTMDTIIYYSDIGINDAMYGWGNVLKKYYGKDSSLVNEDPTVKYLGYWTDNGAFYYHHTDPGYNYEQIIVQQRDFSAHNGVPYRYVQYDDWWYYHDQQGSYGGNVKWEPMPTVFPDGLQYMYNKTGWGVHAHNRWWSNQTVYAKQNGGKFDFITSGQYALPTQLEFWEHLFNQAVQWGLLVYEQDFLVTQMQHIEQLQTDLYLGEMWLKQMGEAASRYGINLQYCMALPRQILAGLEIPAITQARVSADYASATQWKIGMTNMFTDAIGIAPFKDNFWTTSKQPGNPLYKNSSEPNPLMQAVVAVLSTGPVGPSDKVGHTDVSIIKQTCRSDGMLLKPSRAATSIDKQFQQEAFGGGVGPQGEVWTTFSDFGNHMMGIIFSAEMTGSFNLRPNHTSFSKQFKSNRPVLMFSRENVARGILPAEFSESAPLTLQGATGWTLGPDTKIPWSLNFTTTPYKIRLGSVAVLGELDKIVPQSPQRIHDVTISTDDVIIELVGVAGEHIDFSVYYQDLAMVKAIPCDFPVSQSLTLSVAKMTCQ